MPASDRLETVVRPKQARSHETLLRLLDAAEALIEEKGLADASIPEIVRRAGSSVGGFYARFHDKDELLRALEERFFGRVWERLEAMADARRWERAPLRELISAAVALLVSVLREHHNLIAAFLARAAHDPEVRIEALRFRQRIAERLSERLLRRRAEIGHPEPALAIDLTVQFAFGLSLQRVLLGDLRAAGRTLSDEEIRLEIERNALAYLGVRAPA